LFRIMIHKLTYLILFIVFILGISSGCVKNETCLSANNLMKAKFFRVESDTTITEATVDTFSMYIVGREDSVLYLNNLKLDSIGVPMADTLHHLKIVIEINHVVDTLYLDYKPYPVFRSTECGVINRYEIQNLSHTSHKIIDINLKNKIIDESEAVNLRMLVDVDD